MEVSIQSDEERYNETNESQIQNSLDVGKGSRKAKKYQRKCMAVKEAISTKCHGVFNGIHELFTSGRNNEVSQSSDKECYSKKLKGLGISGTNKREINSNSNRNFSEGEFIEPILDEHEMQASRELVTLEDAVRHFGLHSYLEELDNSLEDVRKHRITEKKHEECFKDIDKLIQKLSLKYHPDRIKNRRGTEDEITAAEKLQTALNATRTVLRYLNTAFLRDTRTDHKFQFYTKLNICSLCNEKEVRSRIYEMKFKMGAISRIKQQNIIVEIRIFLIESKKCISKFLGGNLSEFKELSYFVLLHLNRCIEGYGKLCTKFEEMEKQCKLKKDEHMLNFVQKMIRDSKRDKMLLYLLEKSAKSSMKGKYKFFNTEEFLDPYFVCPFVWYINVILMCNAMVRNSSFWDALRIPSLNPPKFKGISDLKPLHYLAEYVSGNKWYEAEVIDILNKEHSSMDFSDCQIHTSEINSKFCEILKRINKEMEIKFNVEHYSEVMTMDVIFLKIEKCVSMMEEFERMKEDLLQVIADIQVKSKQIDEMMRT